MRRARCPILLLAAVLLGCGGYKAPSGNPAVSRIANRVFVSNETTNALDIIDASKDQLGTITDSQTGQITNTTIPLNAGPTTVLETADKKTVVVYLAITPGISIVDTATESQLAAVSFPGPATSVVMSSDGTRAYGATPNTACSGSSVNGGVTAVNLVTGKVIACVPLANARNLVLSHDGKTLLVFRQDVNSATSLDTKSFAATVIDSAGTTLDRPVSAVFVNGDATALIVSCGPECGGTTARITTWARASNTFGASADLTSLGAGAREALLANGNLYVAGSDPVAGGTLLILDPGTLAPKNNPVAIADGIHDTMLFTNGQVFIGARGCTLAAHGCLSIYNNGKVTFSAPNPNPNTSSNGDDVTGMEPIPNRSVVYVCEGGELRIYDTGTDALQAKQIDLVGDAVDVREVF